MGIVNENAFAATRFEDLWNDLSLWQNISQGKCHGKKEG